MLEFGVMGEGSHGQMAVVAFSNAAEIGKKVDEHLRRVMPPTPEGTYPVSYTHLKVIARPARHGQHVARTHLDCDDGACVRVAAGAALFRSARRDFADTAGPGLLLSLIHI